MAIHKKKVSLTSESEYITIQFSSDKVVEFAIEGSTMRMTIPKELAKDIHDIIKEHGNRE